MIHVPFDVAHGCPEVCLCNGYWIVDLDNRTTFYLQTLLLVIADESLKTARTPLLHLFWSSVMRFEATLCHSTLLSPYLQSEVNFYP
ncbi:hypothetical protein TNCV_4231051 [Trichonephila clavipes]|uniref:Uncharacterized protein n=1 Tax=Trichonephila clavipes TaxID=2585209 RepID=A0A8X6SEB1_TRICX|nr:hypothetical protein TNCV_4231051 [Trichonephila clavipes]